MKIPIAKLEKFVIPEKDAVGSPMQHLWLDDGLPRHIVCPTAPEGQEVASDAQETGVHANG